MKIILGGRQSGKTTQLVKISARGNAPILCLDVQRLHNIWFIARKLELEIPEPITLRDFLNGRIRGRESQTILVDDAEMILLSLLAMTNPRLNVVVAAIDVSEAILNTEEKK